MSSKKIEGVKKFGGFLKVSFRKKSISSSTSSSQIARPAFSDTETNTPHTTSPGNVISGSGTVTEQSISLFTRTGPTSITGDQPPKPQSPTIFMPGKNDAFHKAIQEYIDNLSDDDRVAFQSATDVIKKLEELQQSIPRISYTTQMHKVQKVLQCVKQFLASIAICVQHSPEISSLVVGGLHCILTVRSYHLTLGLLVFTITDMNLFPWDSLHWGTLSFLRALQT